MKEVTIKSKIVGREGSGTGVPYPSSPSASVDLSLYLKKEVWDDAFELKETEDGVHYLFGKLPVLLQYGLTMYADPDNVGIPSLFDGIPIDNNTIYWDETTNADGSVTRVLKAKGVGGEGGSATLLGDLKNVGEWANAIATEDRIMVQKKGSDQWVSLSLKDLGNASFENVKESGEGNAFTSFTLSEDKKTLTFVKGETFTKKADFDTLNTKVTDFLEGSDTDGIINKWKELEAFLEGMKQSDDLATILATKWTKDDEKISNWDAAFSWGDHNKKGYALKTYVDETFVTIGGEPQTITGKKDFTTGGLFVNGSQIVYDSKNGYWKLDGDLLVTGAITMFANEGKYTPSTIMDGVNVDGTTIIKSGNKLMLNPDLELGGGGLDEAALASYLSSWAGSSSIKNVGTITSGTWNGSKIANAYLANSAVTISGKSVSLGGSLSQADLRTALGLGSNAYTSTSYLPSASYTAADVLAKLKTVDGADSGLDADLLDGYHVSRFPLLNAVCGSSYDLNNADRAGYYKVSMSTNRPSDAYGYGMMETIEVHTGVSDSEKRTLQVYYPHIVTTDYKYYGMAVRMSNNNVWGAWKYFVTKDGNVASATTASKLSTASAYTAWGQTYWTSGGVPTSISGDMSNVGNVTSKTSNTYSFGSSSNLWKELWTGSVKYSSSTYLIFTDTYVGIATTSVASQLIVTKDAVRTNSTTSYRVPLGTISIPWAGLYLGGGSMPNVNGINFTDGSTYVVNQICGNSAGGVGIYSSSSIFLRGGCTKGTSKVTSSGTGVSIDASGNVLATGGITMYGSSDKRLKKNIRTFHAGKVLMSLGGVYQFEYEDEEISRNAMYKGTHVGLIYQNVKGTILDKMCYEREDGYGALNYLDSSFISLLAGVSVEHETRIQRLERENEELRKEIEQLKKHKIWQ